MLQGTLIAMTSFCQGNLVNMLKSAALLGPVAYMDQVDSPLARGAADSFIADVKFMHMHALYIFNIKLITFSIYFKL